MITTQYFFSVVIYKQTNCCTTAVWFSLTLLHDSNGHFICTHTGDTPAYLLYTNTGTCHCEFWPF